MVVGINDNTKDKAATTVPSTKILSAIKTLLNIHDEHKGEVNILLHHNSYARITEQVLWGLE